MINFFQILILLSVYSYYHNSALLIENKGESSIENSKFIRYIVNLKRFDIDFYWKDNNGNNLGNAKNLKKFLKVKGRELLFATNGGMYLKDQSPQGLYIENYKTQKKKDSIQNAYGNFYMQPNGIFSINSNREAIVCKTDCFNSTDNIKYATQSGSMLLIDGELHVKFKKESTSKFIRNGVGVLPTGEVVFVMSKNIINFYDFALYFKSIGCKNALYLDGFVSRTYLPSKNWIQEDGDFGVMIAVTKLKN